LVDLDELLGREHGGLRVRLRVLGDDLDPAPAGAAGGVHRLGGGDDHLLHAGAVGPADTRDRAERADADHVGALGADDGRSGDKRRTGGDGAQKFASGRLHGMSSGSWVLGFLRYASSVFLTKRPSF